MIKTIRLLSWGVLNIFQMNKLAGMTLEGVLHVWDCRQLDVRSRAGSRHSPHNRELLMVGALSLYQYHYPDNRVASDT